MPVTAWKFRLSVVETFVAASREGMQAVFCRKQRLLISKTSLEYSQLSLDSTQELQHRRSHKISRRRMVLNEPERDFGRVFRCCGLYRRRTRMAFGYE